MLGCRILSATASTTAGQSPPLVLVSIDKRARGHLLLREHLFG
jgi:flavin reductase (DIM6/NTAB) family NADH-FMN oxidoreductase RutF